MRVAMISTPFIAVPPANYGGTELIIHELTEGLVARGHEVTLFATGDSRTTAELRWMFPRPQWPPDTYTDLTHVSRAMRGIEAGDYDIVHAHSAMALALGHFLPGTPLLYTIHHDRDECLSAYYVANQETHYIAISADQRSREVPLARFEVIHHGLDPAKYEAHPRAHDYLCFVGRFSEIKGPHSAIDAAEGAGLPIRLAGEVHPPDRGFAERELAWRLTLPHVSYLGCIGIEEKRPLLRDARALLAPIAWNEPFGLILIEAMLSGCPVVAFGRGSVPELVEEGVTGFVVHTVEEMAETVRRGGPLDQFDRMRCRARAVERFAADRMVTEHERLYERVLTGAPVGDAPTHSFRVA